MLRQLVWMIAGGLAAVLVYGASRTVVRWRSVNVISPRQWSPPERDEHEEAGI